MDYFLARYYSSSQGRFTSCDPLSGKESVPQSWNRYVYTINNPLKYFDPDGLDWYNKNNVWYWFPGSEERKGYVHLTSPVRIDNVKGAFGFAKPYNGHNITI